MPGFKSLLGTLPKLTVLLLLLPVAIALQVLEVGGPWLFLVSGLAILGTVTLIGKATEEIAIYAGPLWGGLLNATFGNVTELIIALFALQAGLHEVVKASIIGSILGNLLLVLGGAMLYGGTKYQTQKFSRTGASVNVGMLWITVIALMVPSLVEMAYQVDPTLTEHSAHELVDNISLAGSGLLLLLYVLSLIFSLRTHRFLLMPGKSDHHEEAEWSKKTAIGMLLGATLCVAYLSEVFVHSIEIFKESGLVDMSEMFIGVVLVAIVGNAAEGLVAVWVAREDKMELSFQIAMGSCLQVALMVAPILVLSSWAMGELMPLSFNVFEMMSLIAAVLISSSALNDGESNWLEGCMFLAVYVFFALVFWFHP